MPNLISPGVSVTVTDESFYIPTAAPTLPLIFIATADEKTQPNGNPAQGTYEHGVVRQVTSIAHAVELYGTPVFLEESVGAGIARPYHGDARNEYGLFALIQFLGVGNVAYVVRADVNLNDELGMPDQEGTVRYMWKRKTEEAKVVLSGLINEYLYEYNLQNGYIPVDPDYKETVTASELISLMDSATVDLFNSFSFRTLKPDFRDDQSAAPLPVYNGPNGYEGPPTGDYYGFIYVAQNIATFPSYPGGQTVVDEFTTQEGADLFIALADDFMYTLEFYKETSLGANDAARRWTIVQQLQAAIGNDEVRSEKFNYNLVLCPGYSEVADEMSTLVTDIHEEAFIIADTPVDRNPEQIYNPSTGWAFQSSIPVDTGSGTQLATGRVFSRNIAYYYPWTYTSDRFTGKNVVAAPSGTVLRAYAYNDDVAYLWFAPAGLRRGNINDITELGYVSGTLGGPTQFNPLHLNQGQRDSLYQQSVAINPLAYFPGQGFVVWGQRTSISTASAMDRVNVSRLVKYIARQLRINALPFVFEPNDQLTRDSLKALVDGFLGDLIVKRGLYDFATVCDESNNTPDRIDRNELWLDIAIKPVKAAEFIYIPIRIVPTGAQI